MSSRGVRSVRTTPFPPNIGSSAPFDRYRTTAKRCRLSVPATTIRPFDWIATERASSPPPAIGVVNFPFPLNVGSSEPSVSYRATANSPVFDGPAAAPTATIRPSDWMATALAKEPTGNAVTTVPPTPKSWSRSPGAASAGVAQTAVTTTHAATTTDPVPRLSPLTITHTPWVATSIVRRSHPRRWGRSTRGTPDHRRIRRTGRVI